MRVFRIVLFAGVLKPRAVDCFQPTSLHHKIAIPTTKKKISLLSLAAAKQNDMSIDELKSALSAYLKKRDESNANESAKRLVFLFLKNFLFLSRALSCLFIYSVQENRTLQKAPFLIFSSTVKQI